MNHPLGQSLDLVRAAQDGDAEALNRLLTRYYEPVRSIVRARMGARLRLAMDSGDILQDTFMKAVKIFDRFEVRNESSLINWLAKLAERQITDAADRIKAEKRDISKQTALDSSPDLDPEAQMTGPLDKLDKSDRHEVLMHALQSLEEEHRELVLQRHFANASWDEIAEMLGKPSADAARMAYGTAKAKLAMKLLALGYRETGQLLGDD